ncbi:MAG TPA: hypothetical protein VGQ27_05175 [Steroidobacteraceae bacterium]|jgi:hypothetical protein|nr:hypothetical protein [Steroidobacteraceae bacterium]
MYERIANSGRKVGISLFAASLLFGGALAWAQEAGPDPTLAAWLGIEFTVETSTINDHMPQGGKLTFVFDKSEDVVRVCTRTATGQKAAWHADFAVPCGVTMTFTRGTRYCTADDVKAGNAEVLSSCHRLRSRDVAMHPPVVKGTIELNDMIAFLVQGTDGKKRMQILVDSPARVTDGGSVGLKE